MHKYKFFDHLFHSRAPSFVRNCQSCTSRIPIDLLRTSLWSCIVSCVVYVLTTNRTYELYHHQVQNTPKWFIQFDTLPVLYLVFSLYFLSKSCKFQRRSAPYSANTFCGGFTQSLVSESFLIKMTTPSQIFLSETLVNSFKSMLQLLLDFFNLVQSTCSLLQNLEVGFFCFFSNKKLLVNLSLASCQKFSDHPSQSEVLPEKLITRMLFISDMIFLASWYIYKLLS